MTHSQTDGTGPAGFAFEDGAGYELMMGRWSALVADPFLDWLGVPRNSDWLDSGCGNGSFTERVSLTQHPLSVVGVDPAPAQLDYARKRPTLGKVRLLQGDAQELPVADASVDAAVMALVLFFLPEPARGVQELMRVVRSGGIVAAYHWDLDAGGLPLQPIIDAACVDGYAPQRPPSAWVATQGASADLWVRTGLLDVQTVRFQITRRFDRFDDFWCTANLNPRLGRLFSSLSPDALKRLKCRVMEQLGTADNAPVFVSAIATGVKGHKR